MLYNITIILDQFSIIKMINIYTLSFKETNTGNLFERDVRYIHHSTLVHVHRRCFHTYKHQHDLKQDVSCHFSLCLCRGE